MLIPNDEVNIINTFSVMIIFILRLLLTNLHLKLLSSQGIGADKLLSTQRVKLESTSVGCFNLAWLFVIIINVFTLNYSLIN